MNRKVALITGITGQDGSYLSELLLSNGYAVHGLLRKIEIDDPSWQIRIEPFRDRLVLHGADLDDFASVQAVIAGVMPTECYHLGAVSYVSYDHEHEATTLATNLGGTQILLSALHATVPECRFFFASSSEMFGRATDSPQSETTRIEPRSVYGISKAAGYFLTRYYRDNHKSFACCGIFFNHESPRRGAGFVTRRITRAVARIAGGDQEKLRLGNLDATRDWGHAADYVRAVWLMLQQDEPGDYVIATGRAHSVREFCDIAFRRVGLRYEDWVETDASLFRPSEPVALVGNTAKAKAVLGWEATTSFEALVHEMVDSDCRLAGVETLRGQTA